MRSGQGKGACTRLGGVRQGGGGKKSVFALGSRPGLS